MNHRKIGPRLVSAALMGPLMLLLSACGTDEDTPSASMTPSQACSALQGRAVDRAAIGLATTGAVVIGAALVPAAAPLGEYCRVSGEIRPVDGAAQSIVFSIAMPSQWNGKAVHFGGGGLNGVVPDTTSPFVDSSPPLARGYAVFAGDSGHQMPGADPFDARFALNDEMLRNYGGDAVKKTRDVAMQLLRDRYGATPSKTYFVGGSKGGHEGMTAMQKWPQDYDGMVTLFPAYSVIPTLLSWQLANRALHLGAGAGFLGPAKLQTLQQAELAACDALDGVADGVVSDTGACQFTPSSLRCAGGTDLGDGCLSDAQVATAQMLRNRVRYPYALKNGIASQAGFNVSTAYLSTGGFGRSPGISSPPESASLGSLSGFADALVRHLIQRDPRASSLAFDPLEPGPYAARVHEMSSLLDASSTDIQPFMKKAKWILVHGQSDSMIPLGSSVDYYEALVARFGQAQVDGFLRFYIIPGYGHAAGPFNATGMTTLDALDRWAESGTPPGPLTVADANPPGRTRPLCQFPNWPKYRGLGDVNAAASFDCVPP